MTDGPEPWPDETGGDPTVTLLRLAGARPPVPDERAARVRAAVRSHWRSRTRRRTLVRRGVLAVVFLAGAAGLIQVSERSDSRLGNSRAESARTVAVVERVDGIAHRRPDVDDAATSVRLSHDEAVRTGEWIVTGAGARLALRFNDGTSVRLDAGSRIRPVSSMALELTAGAVYVDRADAARGFEVQTPLATARDIGTQFEVRLLERAVRLRVRSGRVELMSGARLVSGGEGTEIMWTDTRAVSRSIAVYGQEWEWTAGLAPPLRIEGMRLSTFLERVAREQGWRVEYADAALATEASGIVLHGSVDGLAPHDAVGVIVATSSLHHRLEHGRLLVLRR